MTDYIFIFNDNVKEVDEMLEKIKSYCGIGVLVWKVCHVCITCGVGILGIVYWGRLGCLVWWFYVAWVGRPMLFSCFVAPMFCCYVLVVCFLVCGYVYVVCVKRDLPFCLFYFCWLFLFFLPSRLILSCSGLVINKILLLKKYPIIKKVWTKLFWFTFLWD